MGSSTHRVKYKNFNDVLKKSMRITQLRSFYAVGRCGSVTAAAKALHVSQPTVTTQVRALEQSYGVELFHRHGRSITLTSAGATLYSIAQRIFSGEEEAIDFLKEVGGLRTGHLKIGAVGPFHAMEIIARFCQHYPGIRIQMTVGNSEQCIRGLLNYETDVAILAQYASHPQLHAVPYRKHPIVVIAASGHPLAARKAIRLKDLEGVPLILREPGSTTRKALEDALRRERIAPTIAMEIGSREAVREAVILGLGIAVVSEREHIEDPRLHKLSILDDGISTFAHVMCLRERLPSRLIDAFFKVVDTILQGRENEGPEASGPASRRPRSRTPRRPGDS